MPGPPPKNPATRAVRRITLDDVDGVCCSGIATGIAEYLDLHPRYVDGTFVGGSSFEVHVEHAAAAIATGLCDVVVGVYASTPRQEVDESVPFFHRHSAVR